MEKITIEYSDRDEALLALNAWKYKNCIDEIWEKVFRPNRKHKFSNELLDSEQAHEVIEELIKIYQKTIEENLGED